MTWSRAGVSARHGQPIELCKAPVTVNINTKVKTCPPVQAPQQIVTSTLKRACSPTYPEATKPRHPSGSPQTTNGVFLVASQLIFICSGIMKCNVPD